MKQYTTKEQLNQLNLDKQYELFLFFNTGVSFKNIIKFGFHLRTKLSIGQMIEFLGDDWINSEFDTGKPGGEMTTVLAEINLKQYALINILWEAVKYKI